MKHYEMLKLRAGADVTGVQEKVWKTLEKLDKKYDWLNYPVICRDCKPDAAWTIMFIADIEDEAKLQDYLSDDGFVKAMNAIGADVIARSTFDHY